MLSCSMALSAMAQYKAITIEDIWSKGTFAASSARTGRSMADGEHYTLMDSKGIAKYSYKTGEKVADLCVFANVKGADGIRFESYEIDEGERQILLSAGFESIYRYSGVSDYYVYNIGSQRLVKISTDGKQRLTAFSPDGSKVAYVRDNNLYVMTLSNLKEQAVTTDGLANHIINGTTDWVYEEEFTITRGFRFSPDSRRIAFYRFDESNVKEYSMQMWGDLYPSEYKYKYPKAGEDNSRVEILIYDLQDKSTLRPELGSENDQYLPRFQWTNDPATLCVMRMNRLQNRMELLLVDAVQNTVSPLYDETSDTYIEVPSTIKFLNDGKNFIISSERGGYNQLYFCDMEGKMQQRITPGEYDVVEVCGIDEKRHQIYYTAHKSSAINTELFVCDFKGRRTTQLSTEEGTHNAVFSKGCRYYIDVFSTTAKAPVTTLYNQKGKAIRVLEDNAALQRKIEEYGANRKRFGTLTTSLGTELNYYVILPEDFDSTKRYPLLFYVYGGPGSQQVVNAYRGGDNYWFHMLSQKGYVVACFDGRGTGGRGTEFRNQTYRNLGAMECEDAIEAARWFGSKAWVDEGRIGIFGWSFGGYLSTLALLKGNDVFKAAIAVAPVTTWRYYDNIYTERFLQRPQDNAEGYDNNSPLNFADRLKGNYLLIHGTGDDNVHFQNAVDMVSALERAGKQFEFRIYPNKNHGIYGGNTRQNLYELMTDFLMRKL
ncbi:MAG: S9 family peptidase [Bacteroidales bacterium]|nr:S9 family peptidase [Bacteroidales bacterium]